MTEHASEAAVDHGDHEEHPVGTWAILGLYLVAIVVMWVWVYALLIARG